VETTQPFVFAARARLEALQPVDDRVLDSGVIAHVEVQKPDLAKASPVASIQHAGLFQADRAGHDFPPIACRDKPQVTLELLAEQIEKFLVQVLAAPIELLDSREID